MFEQSVIHDKLIYKQRVKLAHEYMRNMVRFYNLDRIICWDLSWGAWEAVVVNNHDHDTNNNNSDDGFPQMVFINKHNQNSIPFPTFLNTADDDNTLSLFYKCAQPITPQLLTQHLKTVSGYYLVGGNTYTMSLFHHMWNDQQLPPQTQTCGHMQLLRNLLSQNKLFYMGHSAGAIMSGSNILTATFKGIDAFSIVTQPYNAPFLKLPPSCDETSDSSSFFVSDKNNLYKSRMQMLHLMNKYKAWRGYDVVMNVLIFPHYDSRPCFASFPQSAETYLSATNEEGQFYQLTGSLLVNDDDDDDDDDTNNRKEPRDVQQIRNETNTRQLPCYPIANGHAILFQCDALSKVVVGIEALSPEEEDGGVLHWDIYMPNVSCPNYEPYTHVAGRSCFAKGCFTKDDNTVAGDRLSDGCYKGGRICSRLDALGLPNVGSCDDVNGLFRSSL